MKTKLFTLALAVLTIGLLGSCKKEEPKVSVTGVTGVTLDKTELTLTVGDPDVKLAATVLPENATDKTVSWSSDKTEFATVDNQGNVHAVAPGEATITVTTTDGGKTATCAVTVKTPVTTFKAVYNTNGGANTLTFYYDANDHSGEGITVYEDGTDKFLFDDTQTYYAKWGYNDKRGEIKSVVIDASVAGYKGLTSTTFMFQGMATATNISGAEHLDVSNVTDMSYMFQNFGGGKSGSPTTLNVVPDVSKWNTGNVTNMSGMFESYGNFSSSLDKVPDVSNWNTGNVTDMSSMFQKYGHESQTFNAVPDVSKWNTGNVTNMQQMFMEYGHKSTALNTVPNVSGWNTGKVTNMKQMFNNYGSTSENISCVLDLSGWDLSKITGTNGNDVFNFNPKTFDVTIPAKTGEKSNEGGKWYYGNGDESITPPEGKTFTPKIAGALKGVFSVSATKKVRFSQGNLVATIDASGAPTAWKFSAHQYDCLGEGGANKTIGVTAGDVDLFGWSTSTDGGTSTTDNYGIKTSTTAIDYSGDFYDWGKAVGDGNTWRTLTTAEWQYLFNYGSYQSDIRKNKYKWATVNGVGGYVIAPDDFTGTLQESYANDAGLADAGNLVFLPAAGFRYGSDVYGVGEIGSYWSSTACGSIDAYGVSFISSDVSPGYDDYRFSGDSVRLVTEVPASASTIEDFNMKGDDSSNWN